MTAVMTVCDVKRGLFRCQQQAVGVCQYCGRPFCRRHCELQDDGQEICSRRFCVEKRHDLERHLRYKALVFERNGAELCGREGCRSTKLAGICVRCRGLFCRNHVDSYQEIIVQNNVRVPRNATLCHHCWARRPIWTRV